MRAEATRPKVQSAPGAALSSWKEIAVFLNVDVRTCQRWEQSFGLPVHRIRDSVRSRVIAYPEEIETWRKKAFRVKNGTADGDPAKAGPEPAGETRREPSIARSRTKRFGAGITLKSWAGMAGAVLAAAALLWAFVPLDRNPVDFRIKGSTLVLCNKHGRRVAEFETKLPKLEAEPFFRRAFPDRLEGTDGDRTFHFYPRIYFQDFDGDGRNEVLFAPHTIDEIGIGWIVLLDARGGEIWRHQTGREIRIGARVYPPDFVVNLLTVGDFNGDGRSEILAVSHCYQEAPTQVTLLDPKKRVLGEYWNYGQIADYLIREPNNGRRELILAGTNNEYDQSILAVLNPEHLTGCSPQSPGFAFGGIAPGGALEYLRCSPNPLDALLLTRGIFIKLRLLGNGHVVAENSRNRFWYEFDTEMNLSAVTVTDAYALAFGEAVKSGAFTGKIDREALSRELASGVLFFDKGSGSWVSRPAGPQAPGRSDRP